ncbi:YopX family protein [Enterococcus faecalis]|uniref:YopX family protein n=1 Tax=Enterococcus faecalis TaxID=1351 RepID=UPI0012ADAF4C|nr:YopX family protein [Enterococcus faecalis]
MKKMIPKFRAYSVDENIMYYPDEDKNVEWTIDDDTGFIAPLINLENGMWGMIDKYVLMQSTGLKDKNGVEIFEGDIVQHRDGEYSYLGIVKRDCYQFFIDGIEPDENYDFIDVSNTFDGTSSLEILGNIWDNKELLEVAE